MKRNNGDGATASAWWSALQPKAGHGGDRGTLARLRRADLPTAMAEPATLELFGKLGRTDPTDLPDVALCAAVLATVRDNKPDEPPARSLGAPNGEPSEKALMKPLRFRRLIEAQMPEERLMLLRRAVQLTRNRINVRELAEACLNWSDTTRQRWIFDYYNAGYAAPGEAPSDSIAKETTA